MKPIFVDTSALIALGNKRDKFHIQAFKINNELRQTNMHYVTTSAIVLEFGNAFSSTNLKSTAIQIIESINMSKKWKCIDVDRSIFEHGFKRYKNYLDKAWGLVDCISMIVAIKLGIIEIFTADKHFEQAGFKILLK